ncbi:MAG: 30S ribosomal protein S6 [Chloroflexi bacterium]|jgi:small subunit ribosomal protein S6|nr:30S ribosomal protein S6 [Chloroflexota bacterium]
MRRYELMLVFRPDAPDERTQAVVERVTRMIVGDGGQIVKVQPWGRRRLAYPIDRHREGQYHIVVFEAPPTTIGEIERSLLITEEVLRHLVIRIERPVRSARKGETAEAGEGDQVVPPLVDEDEVEPDGERIDESESEAAPAAVD